MRAASNTQLLLAEFERRRGAGDVLLPTSRHEFGPQGRFDGERYHQTFIQQATVVETGGYAHATTQHVCGPGSARTTRR